MKYILLVITYLISFLYSTLTINLSAYEIKSKKLSDPYEKKKSFFEHLIPYIDNENKLIEAKRKKIKALFNQAKLNNHEKAWLKQLSDDYSYKSEGYYSKSWFNNLLKRVDILPASMVLAQAALESAWGTSRFAKDGNNFFGIWCFSKGCGIVPKRRPDGQNFEVRQFSSVRESVNSYFKMINSYHMYEKLRELRYDARIKNIKITSKLLIPGLVHYSAKKNQYVVDLCNFIKKNVVVMGSSYSQENMPEDCTAFLKIH